MTEAELAEIEAREQAATPGPWIPFGEDPLVPFPPEVIRERSFKISTPADDEPESAGMNPQDTNIPIAMVYHYDMGDAEAYANRDFIAAARSDIPALLAEVRRLHQLEAPEGTP